MPELYHTNQLPLLPTKTCNRCNIEKLIEEFYRDRKTRDGYRASCKICFHLRKSDEVVQRPISKVCSICHVEKKLEQFYPQRNGMYGYRSDCKECSNTNTKQRRKRILAQEPMQVKSKICTACKLEKAISEFGNSQVTLDRHAPQCKSCMSKRNRTYYAMNRERLNIYHRIWMNNPIRRERKRAYGRAYSRIHNAENVANARQRRMNDSAYRDRQKRYHAIRGIEKRDQILAYERRWRKANNLKCREYHRRYLAQKRATLTEKVDYACVLAANNGLCYICNHPILPCHLIEFDHRIPLDRGGPHIERNLEVVHRCCNRRKQNKLLSEMTPFQRRGPSS